MANPKAKAGSHRKTDLKYMMLSQKEPSSDEQSDAVDEPAANSCSREKMALYLKVHTSLKSATAHGAC